MPANTSSPPCAKSPSRNSTATPPERAARYWDEAIRPHPYFSPDVECLVAVLLNTRKKIIGHQLVSTGTIDTILVSQLGVFRAAIVANAPALILMHNHPSGDPTPSEADIKITRDLIRGGQLLKVELLDHLVIGAPSATRTKAWSSLRELGYFYQ